MAERNAPGIAEYIRYRSMELTSRAMLGRGVSVIEENVNRQPSRKPEGGGGKPWLYPGAFGARLKDFAGSASECARRQLTDKIGWGN